MLNLLTITDSAFVLLTNWESLFCLQPRAPHAALRLLAPPLTLTACKLSISPPFASLCRPFLSCSPLTPSPFPCMCVRVCVHTYVYVRVPITNTYPFILISYSRCHYFSLSAFCFLSSCVSVGGDLPLRTGAQISTDSFN